MKRETNTPISPEKSEKIKPVNHQGQINFLELLRQEQDPSFRDDLRLALDIAEAVKAFGGQAFVVGGYSRDLIMRDFGYELSSKDIDLEVYGVPIDELQKLLGNFGKVDAVGKSYQALKIKGVDVTIPRRDSKKGSGHGAIEAVGDPYMSIPEAAKRRDLTINAIMVDPLTGKIEDPYNGISDIQNKILRVVDKNTFVEDSLRVLRVMQFAGRFGYTVDPETIALCRETSPADQTASRFKEEWWKMLLRSPKPSYGLEIGDQLGIFEKIHPEIAALKGVQQDKEWHPEGDVMTHTKMVLDVASEVTIRENLPVEDRLVVMLAALTHDFGKPGVTKFEDGKWRAIGHEIAGGKPALKFLETIGTPKDMIDKILPLIVAHDWPMMEEISDTAIRRVTKRLEPANLDMLLMVFEADSRGRGTDALSAFDHSKVLEIKRRAEELGVSKEAIKPLVTGKDLMEIGMKPSTNFGVVIAYVFEEQQQGRINTKKEAVDRVKELLDELDKKS